MKIGIDIRSLMDKYYGGVSEFTYQLLKSLFEIDQTNQYVLFYNSGKDVKNRIPDFKKSNVEIKYTAYPNKIFNYVMQKNLKWPKVDQFLGVDKFFMPHFNFISLCPETELILTIHDLSFLRFKEHFSLRKNIWHNLLNVKKLINRADRIIAISKNTKNDIIELCGVDDRKIKVIYSGINNQIKTHNPEKIKKKYKLPAKFILSLNTVEPRKNIVGLIQAFDLFMSENKYSDIELVIAGAKGWKYKKIIDHWKESKNKNKIHFIDYIDNFDKPGLYRLAEIFIYPSFYEGFGFPPLEAMTAMCPVIASGASSLGEVCGSAAILIDPNNPQSISQAIGNVLKNDVLRQNLIDRGLAQVEKFSWEKTALDYYSVFC
jgi:glycosyltransferase involved in cell wall biosynthesis